TLSWLKEHGAAVTVCSHLGRPKDDKDMRFSMEPVSRRLAEICPGIEMMENLRFHHGEKAGDPSFGERLVAGFDAYVNEAFGVAHRPHASILFPPKRLPSAAGRRLAEEVEVVGGLMEDPRRPFVVVLGGAKVGDKLGVLAALTKKADVVAVGGAMAFTFLRAIGRNVGASMVDESKLAGCMELLEGHPDRFLLPVDVVALEPGGTPPGSRASDMGGSSGTKVLGGDIPDGWRALDIGPETAEAFASVIASAGTVFWNGPVGVFEDERFADGTQTVASAIASSSAFSVVGGGDSVAALHSLGLAERIDFVSTGGGASLCLLEECDLAALRALRSAPNAPPVGQRSR
ncbi:MAG: phosphoglycerate kinase, partial [Acidimicrobiales bacterium]